MPEIVIRVTFQIAVAIWLLASIGLCIYLYFQSTGRFTKLFQVTQLFFITIGFGATALAVYIQSVTSKRLLQLQLQEREAGKKKYSLDMLRHWDGPDFKQERDAYRHMRLHKSQVSNDDFIREIDCDAAQKNAILNIANLFEDVQQALACGIADEAVLANGFAPLVSSINWTYSVWFDHLKSTDHRYYDQFQPFFNLLERWK